MSASPAEVSPWIELNVGNEKLAAAEIGALSVAVEADDPEKSIKHSLIALRAFVIRIVAGRLKSHQDIDHVVMAAELDKAWVEFRPAYRRSTVRFLAMAYTEAFIRARAGQVDPNLINALAVEHADRMGQYFHDTSKEALLQGFNTYVNRKVPAKTAAVRMLEAYGLTPRQVSGMTALKEPGVVASAVPRDLKSRIRAYIGRSFAQRLGVFAAQEEHNVNMQAAQTAWLWMVEHGKMGPEAQKIWITAKDERVCGVCGPLHGTTALVTEKFVTQDGQHFWVPGAHVNCRCWVRVREPLKRHLQPIHKAGISYIDWEPDEHPRDGEGRFSAKVRTLTREPQTQTQAQPELRGPNLSGGPVLSSPTLSGPQLSGPDLSSGPDLGGSPNLSAANVVVGPRLDIPDLMLAPPKLSAMVARAPDLSRQVEVGPDLSHRVEATTRPDYNPVRLPPKPAPMKRPVKLFTEKDAPYVVLEQWELDTDDGHVDLNEGHSFTSIGGIAAKQGDEAFYGDVQARAENLARNPKQVILKPEHLGKGERLPSGLSKANAQLRQGEEWSVVYGASMVGRHQSVENEHYWARSEVEFQVMVPDPSDPEGYQEEIISVPILKAAQLLGIKTGDVPKVYIARLREGLKETTHETIDPDRRGRKLWQTNGRYVIKQSDKTENVGGVQVPIMELYVDHDYYRAADEVDRG